MWRELGALDLAALKLDNAKQELAYYVEYREYDPEGLFLWVKPCVCPAILRRHARLIRKRSRPWPPLRHIAGTI